ncbi:MAG: class I SAM-dependent methyltransferase [Oscillospiraceae bacterium]|jgi:ubiquinone/menaquinone biosynthesis C-methylase UbiE|nr:class I SAM-dependent methyltransferase [Oscillospiraceae bacterium]
MYFKRRQRMVALQRKTARAPRPPRSRRAHWLTELVWRRVLSLTVAYPGDTLLDMACADGELLRRIGARVSVDLAGICATPQLARTARARLPDADIMFADVDDLPWLDDSFDVAVCTLSVPAMRAPNAAFAEAYRVLAPGGQFVVAAPWLPMPFRGLVNRFLVEDEPDSAPVYAAAQVRAALRRAGFTRISATRVSMAAGVYVGWKMP